MNLTQFTQALDKKKIEYSANEPMSRHTSFGVGGEADVFVSVNNTADLIFVLENAKECALPTFILGKGSNLLVSDKGIAGVVVYTGKMNNISVFGETVTAECGVKLSTLCNTLLENSLSGLEFGYGIPGTVGGAVFMNAGAYIGEIKDVLVSCEYIDENLELKKINLADMALSYRNSIFQKKNFIVTSATMKFKLGDADEIKAKMDDFISRRKQKQPLEYKSAGSTFKRPEGNFAGALIEKCGLKGKRVGGAEVSEKHAGFIVNKGNATCGDILALIELVKQEVYEKTGYTLEPEVRFVGRR